MSQKSADSSPGRTNDMQLGIFAKTFARPTVEEAFDAVAAHGLRCVQFNFASAGLPSLPDQIDSAMLDRIQRAAADRGIAIAAVSGTFNMIHPDPARRREALPRLEVVASACSRLGTQMVTLCTGTRDLKDMWKHHPDNDSPEAWRDLLVTLTAALATAEAHGVALGVEPETGNVIDSALKARRLLDELKSPRLKIIIDAANLFHPGDSSRQAEVLDDAFQLLGRDIILAHAKELGAEGHPGNLALGTGVLNWDRYLMLLHRARFSGPLIMHGFDEREAGRGVAFLRDKLKLLVEN